MSLKRQSMSAVDTAWFRMDSPENLMMITGIMSFEVPLERKTLRKLLQERFLQFPRFRYIPRRGFTGCYWEEDREFDLDRHIQLVSLPYPGDRQQLAELAGVLASTPLAEDRPLWEFHLVEGADGARALISRIHHAYADGIALVQVLLSMTDRRRQVPKRKAADRAADTKTPMQSRIGRLYEPAFELAEGTLRATQRLWIAGVTLAMDPGRALHRARQGLDMAGELARIALLSDDPASCLKQPMTGLKKLAWATPIELARVKAVGKAMGYTVNDVLLACAAGAIGSFMRRQGKLEKGTVIRASVPVNMRPPGKALSLGNHFGLVMLDLPVGLTDPAKRVDALHRSMEELKRSYQPLVALGLLGAMGLAPRAIQQLALDLLSRKASTVMSNVPGPQEPLFLGGSRITEQMFWVPQTGAIGVGVSILSYDQQVFFGLIADKQIIPQPMTVARQFNAEFERLVTGVDKRAKGRKKRTPR